MFPHIHLGIEGVFPWMLYIAMYVAFVASVFWRPSVGLYLLVFTLPMQTGRYKLHDFLLGPQFLDILLLGVVLGLWLNEHYAPRPQTCKRFLFLYAAFLYFSLWEGSLFIGTPLPLWISDPRVSDWKNYVEMFLLAILVASAIKNKFEVRLLFMTMCLSVLIINRNYYSLLSGRDVSQFSDSLRDSGPLGYAGVNGFAAFEAMFSSFLLGFYVYTRNIFVKLGIIALLATCGYCLLFSFSRGGYAGVLFGIITVGILRARRFLVVAILLLLGWQFVLPNAVQQRILMTTSDTAPGGQFDSSSEERLTLWQDAIDLFKHNPITGTGFQTYKYMERVGPYRDTHNYYVKVLVETGIVGLMVYLILLGKLFTAGRQLLSISTDRLWSGIGLGFVAATVCGAVLNFFGDRWTYQQVDGYLWVWLGFVLQGLMIMRNQAIDPGIKGENYAIPQEPAVVAV